MVPGPRFDKPGKSPFMDMQLVPVYADEASDARREDQPDGAAEPRHPHRDGEEGRRVVVVRRRRHGAVRRAAERGRADARRRLRRAPGRARADGAGPQGPGRWRPSSRRNGWRRRTSCWRSSAPASRGHRRRGARAHARDVDSRVAHPPERGGRHGAGALHARLRRSAASSPSWACAKAWPCTPGMTLFRIAGLEKVWAVAEVPEAQAVRLARGQKVKAVLQADAVADLRRRAEGDPAAGQREHAHAAGALRGRQQGGKLTPGMLLRLQVAGPSSSAPGRAVRGRHPHRHARGRHRAQGRGRVRAARGHARRRPRRRARGASKG